MTTEQQGEKFEWKTERVLWWFCPPTKLEGAQIINRASAPSELLKIMQEKNVFQFFVDSMGGLGSEMPFVILVIKS